MRKTSQEVKKHHDSVFVSITLFLLSVILSGLCVAFSVEVESRLIDALIQVVGGAGEAAIVIKTLILLFSISLLSHFLPIVNQNQKERLKQYGEGKYGRKLIEKVARLRYELIEDKEVSILYTRVSSKLDERIEGLLLHSGNLISAVISIIGFLIVIIKNSWIVACSFVVLFCFLLFFSSRAAKAFFKMNRQFGDTEKRVMYLDSVINTKPYAHERKIFDYTEWVDEKRSGFLLGQRKVMRKYDFRYGITYSVIETAGYICTVLIMLVMLPQILNQTLSIGLFIAISRATVNLNLVTQNQLKASMSNLFEQRRYWKEYNELLNLEEDTNIEGDVIAEFQSLEFRDVHFAYPDGTEVLKGANFTIEKGKHYALVGENGAGKSTLIKLMLRLYHVSSGVILLNGKNIEEYDTEQLRRIYACVFQDFSRYQVTARDNIMMNQMPDEARLKVVEAEAELEQVMDKLPEKEDTYLGETYENSANLSGGEWQKIALARALYRNGKIILLDEPTSALDPIAENQIYEKYAQVMQGRTTVFITHRLASSKIADSILVLKDGVIEENDNFDALMEKHGFFYELFNSQRKWYVGGVEEDEE